MTRGRWLLLGIVAVLTHSILGVESGPRRNPFEFSAAPAVISPTKATGAAEKKPARPSVVDPMAEVLKLQGILMVSTMDGQVIINGVAVGVGELYRGWRLVTITPTGAVVTKDKTRRELRL